MAENLRHDDPDDDRLRTARVELVSECAREGENCLYTSTSFYIWLRCLRWIRGALWVGAAVASAVAASHILRGDPSNRIWMAAAALAGVVLPGVGRALRLDSAIRDYAAAAAAFKNLQGEFRRAEKIWSQKPFPEFEGEARKLFRAMNEARKPSLTPPEFCFWLARRKIKKGHYRSDEDETKQREQ